LSHHLTYWIFLQRDPGWRKCRNCGVCFRLPKEQNWRYMACVSGGTVMKFWCYIPLKINALFKI
jgi:hypothetical protein